MDFQLAPLNIGRLLHPPGHPQIREFVDGLDHTNALADQRPGFVWRLRRSRDPFMLVNMSVWKSAEDLKQFVCPIPNLEEARQRLGSYRDCGAPPHAFWFGKPFPAPAAWVAPV
jgi:hypothetical protein